jgi:solute:Na+ symporter, SSS family
LLLLINTRLASRITQLTDFFQAGKQLGPWAIAISIVSSWFGASSTMGQMQKLHGHGVSALWSLTIPSVLSCILVWFALGARMARQPYLSLPEAVRHAYGKWARVGLSATVLASNTAFVGAELMAAGQLFETVMHVPRWLGIGVFGLMIVMYATMAGFWTVVMTDFFHFGFLLIAMMILLASVLGDPGNPLLQVWLHPPTPQFWDIWANPAYHICLTLVFILGWSIDPLMWQRMSAVSTAQRAKQAIGLATIILALLLGAVVIAGLASPVIVGQAEPGSVLIAMTQTLPDHLAVLVLLGIMTALASTVDSCLNVSSLTLTYDGYAVLAPQSSKRAQLWVARASTGLMLLPAGWIALTQSDIIKVFWLAADVYVCALFIPMMGMLFAPVPGTISPRVRRGGQWAMAVGLVVLVWHTMGRLCHWPWMAGYPYSTLLGFSYSAIAFALGYSTRPKPHDSRSLPQ